MAANKKHGARFCLQFDPDDPQQQPVIRILNNLGRGEKSAFIVKAVLHYVSCEETPMPETLFPLPDDTTYVITQSQLEAVVRAVISRIEPIEDNVNSPDTTPVENISEADRDAAILNAASIFNF